MLIEEPLQKPCNKLVRRALGCIRLVYGIYGIRDMLAGKLVLVLDKDDLCTEGLGTAEGV